MGKSMAVSVVQVLVWWMLLTEEAKESLGVFGKVSECAKAGEVRRDLVVGSLEDGNLWTREGTGGSNGYKRRRARPGRYPRSTA